MMFLFVCGIIGLIFLILFIWFRVLADTRSSEYYADVFLRLSGISGCICIADVIFFGASWILQTL